MKYVFLVILCFCLLFIGFHPGYLVPDENGAFSVPTFTEVFGFGYELTFGTIEMGTSIFKGPEAFLLRFESWSRTVFGNFTIFDFLDQFTDKFPILRQLKEFVEFVIAPLQDDFGDLVEWIKDKLN